MMGDEARGKRRGLLRIESLREINGENVVALEEAPPRH